MATFNTVTTTVGYEITGGWGGENDTCNKGKGKKCSTQRKVVVNETFFKLSLHHYSV